MKTHVRALLIGLLTSLTSGNVLLAEDKSAEVRNLDLKTIEKLGNELYKRDTLAATATDLLFEKHPEAKEMKFGGWLTEIGAGVSRVYLFKRADDGVKQGYVAVFSDGKEPRITEHLDEPIPEELKPRLLARSTAIEAIPGFFDRPYNFEVLDDPDGTGFIVYALAATNDANEIVVGGHYRVTVTEDGKKAESVDALSKSLLILPKRPPEAEKEVVAFTVSHIVSATPVETHVFLSRLHGKSFFVTTGKDALWKVENGCITAVEGKANHPSAGQAPTGPEPEPEAGGKSPSQTGAPSR